MDRKTVLAAPAYSISEAAHLLRLPKATLRAWVMGQHYSGRTGNPRSFKSVIEIADPERRYLSFINLVEAHVLSAIRREHKVQLPKVRTALDFVASQLGIQRPLADQQFKTDGVSLFVDELNRLVNASSGGQVAMREVLELHLKRIDRDPKGIPIRLRPFTKNEPDPADDGIVVIDPQIAFGRPVILRLGIPTAIIAERFEAGDSIADLADDYAARMDEIEEAIRCELELKAA